MIDVGAFEQGDVVGEQLQRHDEGDARGEVVQDAEADDVRIGEARGIDAVVGEDDEAAAARLHDFEVAADFFGEGVVFDERQHRHVFVNQRQRPVFEFACRVRFGVDVGQFFQFERAFGGDGVVFAAAEVEAAVALFECFGGLVRRR